MFTIRYRPEATEPVADERVAALLDAAAAPTEAGPVPGEAAALAAFRASQQTRRSRGSRTHSARRPLRVAAAAVVGAGVLLTGGLTAAQAGMLPGAAQAIAQEMLENLQISVPGPDEHSDGHPQQRGSSADAPGTTDSDGRGSAAGRRQPAVGKGSEVSGMAADGSDTGIDKGAEISKVASDGKSQAGEKGKAQAQDRPSGSAADGQAPVTTPNTSSTDRPGGTGGAQDTAPVTRPSSGGTGTGSTASGGAADQGTGTADTATGARSAGGAADSPDNP